MSHLTELAAGAALLVAAAVGTMWAAVPKPKPEPPPTQKESVQTPVAADRVEAEPLSKKEVQQRKIDQVDQKLKHVETQAVRIEKKLEALEAENGSNGKRQR